MLGSTLELCYQSKKANSQTVVGGMEGGNVEAGPQHALKAVFIPIPETL